jgi:GT2 family glycosyltransferase
MAVAMKGMRPVEDNGRALLMTESNALKPVVGCVLVNWNGRADTMACLESLMLQQYASLRVVVVDNGSADGSVGAIRTAFPQVTVLEAGKNLGFTAGSNLGIECAVKNGADFVWLLNNDTVAPPDTCGKLVAKAMLEPKAGLIGSVLYYMHDPGRVQAWGGGDITVWMGRSTHFSGTVALGPTSYLTFASVLIPREVLLRVGILYEGSFMYWDDSDYALRVTKAGYGLAVAEDTAILHKEGGSATRRSPVVDRYSTTAGLHFLRRHAAAPWFSMPLFVALKLGNRVVRLEGENVRGVWLGVRDYWAQRGKVFRERL